MTHTSLPDRAARIVDADLLKLPSFKVADIKSNFPKSMTFVDPSAPPPKPTVTMDFDALSKRFSEMSDFVVDNEEFLEGLTLADIIEVFHLCKCVANCSRLLELADEYAEFAMETVPFDCADWLSNNPYEVVNRLVALLPLFKESLGELVTVAYIAKTHAAIDAHLSE